MKITVYRQASKELQNGMIVYKGEDARPYVDEQSFIVADGMGGAASIFHESIVPELFDSEKLMDTLFAGVYEDYGNDVFVNYVKDSFYELFAVKDCYNKDENYSVYNIKKGGYFASRLASAIVLHELLYNEAYKAERVFEELAKCETDEARTAYLSDVGQHFKELIQTKLKAIAKNANLVYESRVANLALLGTTLCATLYLEHEDRVEAIYLTAGDSRPYVWSEKNGLSQVLSDQEAADERVTNFISANEDADFVINCDYFSFEKPCILFNTSDGCFDSKRFMISQMAFEKLILDSAAESESAEEMGEKLTEFFKDNGRHDDSSTIAMVTFGYEGFEDFKKACESRSGTMQEEYFDIMGDLLEVDHVAAYEACARDLPIQMAALKEKLSSEPAMIKYCEDHVRSGNNEQYLEAIKEIDKKIETERCRIGGAVEAIASVVAANYIKFRPFIAHNDTFIEKINMSRVELVERKRQETADEYIARVQKCIDDFHDAVKVMTELLDKVYEVGVPASFEDFDNISFELLGDCMKNMNRAFGLFGGIRSHKLDLIKRLIEQREEYIFKNRKLAEKNPAVVKRVCALIIGEKIEVSDVDILEEERLEIFENLALISEASENIGKLENEEKARTLNEARLAYWESKYAFVIHEVINAPECSLDEDLVKEAHEILDGLKDKIKELMKSRDKQQELFEKYQINYCMYIGGNNK